MVGEGGEEQETSIAKEMRDVKNETLKGKSRKRTEQDGLGEFAR